MRRRAIDKVYKRRDKIEMPDFQREEVWPDSKKQILIDSILRGWHLPKFYFKKGADGEFECVDGQQRLNAIFEFFDGKISLSGDAPGKLAGASYRDLDDEASDAFDDFELEVEEIEDASDEDLEELFRRLQLGTPLNTAEKLNAVMGELRTFCHDCARMTFFSEKLPIKNTRYAHFEIIARWAFIEARSIQPQMRLKQLEEFFKANRKFSKTSELAKNLEAAIDFMDAAFEKAPTFIANRANTLSVCMLASDIVSAGLTTKENAKTFASFLRRFFSDLSTEVQKGVKANDPDLLLYQQSISAGSTGGDSIRSRINVLSRRLVLEHVEFAPILGGMAKLPSVMAEPLTALAEQIRVEIYKINKAYSTAHGEDMFKLTNESAKALSDLHKPITGKDAYGDFIDSLYFLVYEGSGSCTRLDSPPPDFAMDVKFLRTALRHDVDHGDEKEIAKKMKRAGEVFQKYSSRATPEECGEEDFLPVQFAVLRGALEMLKDLA